MATSAPRPALVGNYDLLEDFECSRASVRVLRLRGESERVEPHAHRQTSQIYVALQGRALVEIDGVPTPLEPYKAVLVPAFAEHCAMAAGIEDAIVMNISVPPLSAADQAPLAPGQPRDLRVPSEGDDMED